ncbi:DUF2510 domain-containing protein [Kibdelosporangium persicum]|nr:DUF2510 domain-containing protein [Kibdelosporangium persicum]
MTRPATWLPDPLDDSLLRYWDGQRWTFHTAMRPAVPQPAPVAPPPVAATPMLRPDIAEALDRTRGTLIGSMKEVKLLETYLLPEERVLALCGAQGQGHGVLACTNRRLLFLFVGIVTKQFLHVSWNDVKHVHYDRRSTRFAVYTTKLTKRAVPAFAVQVSSMQDATAIGSAAQAAAAAPRLDVV